MRSSLLAACLTLVLGAQFSSGQQITVRFINAKTGQPFIVKGGEVRVFSYDSLPSPTNRSIRDVAPYFQVKQEPDGSIILRPSPPVICVDPNVLFMDTVKCGLPCFRTKDLLKRGAVSENKCDPKGKLKSKFIPKPGEFILFVRRYTFWDTL